METLLLLVALCQPTPNPIFGPGIVTSPEELPTTLGGDAWNNLVEWADNDQTEPDTNKQLDFANKDENDDMVILAMAITGIAKIPDDRTLLRTAADMILGPDGVGPVGVFDIADGGPDWPESYARNVAPVMVAWYDLITQSNLSPPVVTLAERQHVDQWADWFPTKVPGTNKSMVEIHEDRPQNIGANAGFTVLSCYVARRRTNDVIHHIDVLWGFLGNANKHNWADSKYGKCGPNDLVCKQWWPDQTARRPVLMLGATKEYPPGSGMFRILSGCLCDDQRREPPPGGNCPPDSSSGCQGFDCACWVWQPHLTNYVWECEQGLSMQVIVAHRLGYNSFGWENSAWLRSLDWINDPSLGNNPVTSGDDDRWVPFAANYYLFTNYPTAGTMNVKPGKCFGFTDFLSLGGTWQ